MLPYMVKTWRYTLSLPARFGLRRGDDSALAAIELFQLECDRPDSGGLSERDGHHPIWKVA